MLILEKESRFVLILSLSISLFLSRSLSLFPYFSFFLSLSHSSLSYSFLSSSVCYNLTIDFKLGMMIPNTVGWKVESLATL